ncbi:hypothetical protein QFZ28_005212 [Neobacillus niacini]|nr:hypothetical protein [Neobacillus niacini]
MPLLFMMLIKIDFFEFIEYYIVKFTNKGKEEKK